MTPVDYAIVALLAWSVIAAFLRGLIRSLFSLAGIALGIVLAGVYYERVAALLTRWVTARSAAETAAFLIIAFAVMLLATLAGFAIRKSCEAIGLGMADRLAGACFGFLRGCLAVTAIVMAIAAFLPKSTLFRQSYLAPYFLTASHGVSFIVPTDFQQRVMNGVSQLKNEAAMVSGHR
ncbi:CvpA family protein [Terriglobus albidus]|uniref:CvpA family protein n=1 Tax=Terriglobus albidus TaxID=1592106 RepID=UPI0021E0805D|nr:CvpA family protein [Terriglobus albidus]